MKQTGVRGMLAGVVAMIVVAGAALVPVQAEPDGGGVVQDILAFVTVDHLRKPIAYVGETDTIEGTALDPNGETDIESVRLRLWSFDVFAYTGVELMYTLSGPEYSSSTPVANGVWDGSPGDDTTLNFSFEYTYVGTDAPCAECTWDVYVNNGYRTETARFAISGPPIEVHSHVYDVLGGESPGRPWSDWSGIPGGAGVGSTFLRVNNSGTDAGQSFTLDFTETVFTAVNDPGAEIPIDGNVRWYFFELAPGDPYPAVFAQNETADMTGSLSLTFSGLGNAYYVSYDIVEVVSPTPGGALPADDYRASYTVSPT